MLSRTARQALATSSRLSTPQSPFLFPLRAASSSTPPPSANTTDTKSRPEVLPRSGFFAQKPKASPPAGRKKDLVVPPLARPPGVPTPPTTERKTWSEKKGEFLDADRHTAKRKALVKEATQGYFHDYNRARSASGGKLWTAPPVLIREDRALYFPDISGKSLNGDKTHTTDLLKGKVSLLSIVSARISEEHVHSFTAPLLPDWPSSQLFQHVQINHQANSLKSMLLSLFLTGLKRQVAEKDWGRYIVSGGAWSQFDVEGPLGIENQLLGYVFLIDDNAKIRWAGCGPATEKEAQDLRTATAVLMRRVMEKTDSAVGAATEGEQRAAESA